MPRSTPPFALKPAMALLLLAPATLMAENTTTFSPVTVTATRSAQTLSEVPSTVSVIDQEQIDRQNINRPADLIRYEPGVSVGGNGSRFGSDGFTIRGVGGNRVLTQIDGVSVPSAFEFGPFLNARRDYIDLDSVKQVEIIRGPASSLYGSDAIGGVVSFISKDAKDYLGADKDFYMRLKTGYDGADDSWMKGATFAGRAGQFDGVLQLTHRHGHALNTYGGQGGIGSSREEANPIDFSTENLLAKLGWDYAPNQRLQLTYEKLNDKADSKIRSSYGTSSSTRIFGTTYSNTLTETSDAEDSTDRQHVSLKHEFDLSSAISDRIQWQLSYQDSQIRQETYDNRYSWMSFGAPSTTPTSAKRERFRDSRYEDTQWGLTSQVDKQISNHFVTYGADLKRSESSNLRRGGERVISTGAIIPSSETFPLSDFPDPTIDKYGLFIQDRIELGRWTLLPGLRYDHFKLKPDVTPEYLNATRADQNPSNFSDDHWSPKFAATYHIDDAHSVYGQYAAGFRAPDAIDIYGEFINAAHGYQTIANPNLKPETSQSLETGLRGEYAHGSFGVALFYNRYEDFIEQVTLASDPTGNGRTTFQNQNLDRVTIRGAEARGDLQLGAFGMPQGSYLKGAVAYARGKDESTGQPINSVDPLKGVFGLGYNHDERFGGELTWTLVAAKERVDETQITNQYEPSGYGIVDLTTRWAIGGGVTVNAGLYNLTDKQYWNWGDVRGITASNAGLSRYSQPGRYGAVNVSWEL
ncbi:hemoglobin/transferrin/lactoferrin receptor protein [Atopomonas hussainii]|uniref:Hemoglobin/transferrin/lactoferrin receptor protein n=1 Tax=Atopomonas hussainii TaxID=1429083 RepID=A0A1H7IT24_9GAMM|nr:TonB-dependent hemoglobin/transferrin/lactoferrin family receptor [Atopomonas hussainii]SEK63935.1 hemoglobin/transferrin/lactoferrin receptor protein [Atopomonas hussainii]